MERYLNLNGTVIDILDVDMRSLRDNGYTRIEWRSIRTGRIESIFETNDTKRRNAFSKILDSANELALVQRGEPKKLTPAERAEEERLLAAQKTAEEKSSAAAGAVLLSGLIAAGVAAFFDNRK